MLCWSTVSTAFKIALRYQSISAVIFAASCTSLLVLGAILAYQGKLQSACLSLHKHWRSALLFASLNPLLYYHILLWAYEILPAQVAQPINYTWAIMLALLSVPFLGHTLRKIDILALIICYAGVVVISLGGTLEASTAHFTGIALALASTIIWASYWILNANDQREPIVGLFQNFLIATPLALVLAWPLNYSWQGLASSVYLGLFEMGIAFVFWFYAMKYTRNTSRISNLIYISPFISLFLIHTILGEDIHRNTYFGLGLIILGLVTQNVGQQKSRPKD